MSPRGASSAPLRLAPADGKRTWQRLWRESITDPRQLLAILGLDEHAQDLLATRDTGFSVRVPRGFVARMRHGDPDDPLLLQVLAQPAELDSVAGFSRDAVGDLDSQAAPGILHKYEGRALLVVSGACAVHCRYCFRRHFPYAQHTASANGWRDAVAHLCADTSIEEVILSGGDPFSISTAKLLELGTELRRASHLQRLRVHTRLPVVLPERVDSELCAWLGGLPWPVSVVIHANHANEIDAGVIAACRRLRAAGAVLLNQSVLLRRVNDSVRALADLSRALFAAGVVPYYLHQLDRVEGTAHYAIEDARATALVEQLRASISGYLVPRLVREIAGEPGKTPL